MRPTCTPRLVDVDPVVGEEVLAVEHEGDGEEVAVAQPAPGLAHLGRRERASEVHGRAQRQRRDHLAGHDRLAAGLDLHHAAVVVEREPLDGSLGAYLAAQAADLGGHRVPHLARPVARVVELGDQALHLVAAVAEEGCLRGAEERQALDSLRCPLGAQLGTRHAPHLLRVGLEEELVEALAEAIGHPFLEAVLAALGLDRGHEIGGKRARELDRAELADHVRAAQRIVQEALVPVDARHARAQKELVVEHLVPEGVDLLGLGEEAVAAEVEAVAVAFLGHRQAAHLFVRLEHDHRQPLLGQEVGGGEARGASAEHHGGLVEQGPTALRGRDEPACRRKRVGHEEGGRG